MVSVLANVRVAALLIFSFLRFTTQINAQLPSFGTAQPVQISTHWSQSAAHPGDDLALAVTLEVREPYHIGYNLAQPPFIPTSIQIKTLPNDLLGSTAVFPEPQEIEFGIGESKEKIKVFSKSAVAFLPIKVLSSASPGERKVEVEIKYQACDDKQCLFPTTLTRSAILSVVPSSTKIEKTNLALFEPLKTLKGRIKVPFFGWDFQIDASNLLLLLGVAAVGGCLLNFTPCVLPMIPIKIMGLSRTSDDRRRCFLLGSILSLGIVCFWVGLAVAISAVSGLTATNQLFQYPAFTIGIGTVICLMAVGMCGFASVQLPQWIYKMNPSQESPLGAFLFGIMTAILSTPCTAPFMGAAAAWAITQRPLITTLTFGVIGLGMAMPYLVLSAFPALLRRMPRTGPASELIKQVMGILMLAAGAYFLGTGISGSLSVPPDPPSTLFWWCVALFIVVAGGWLAWRTWHIARSATARYAFSALGVFLIITGLTAGRRLTESSPVKWIYFTPERFAEAQRLGKTVVLDFTAGWCLNCQALEQAVLDHADVVESLNAPDVAPIKVDLTGKNIEGNRRLAETGHPLIPFLLVYAKDGKEVFSSDAYSKDQVLAAIRTARQRQ